MYADKSIACIDCGARSSSRRTSRVLREGLFQRAEARKNCRDKRKTGGFGEGGARQLYNVTCDACGKATQVPFNPTNGKPVYCRDCYRDRRAAAAERLTHRL
jgi:CxxC-x17-CxxC domain-containing protein